MVKETTIKLTRKTKKILEKMKRGKMTFEDIILGLLKRKKNQKGGK